MNKICLLLVFDLRKGAGKVRGRAGWSRDVIDMPAPDYIKKIACERNHILLILVQKSDETKEENIDAIVSFFILKLISVNLIFCKLFHWFYFIWFKIRFRGNHYN